MSQKNDEWSLEQSELLNAMESCSGACDKKDANCILTCVSRTADLGTMQSPLLEIVHQSGPNQIVIAQTWDESVKLNEGPRLKAARKIHESYKQASCPLFSECHNVRYQKTYHTKNLIKILIFF